MTQKDYRAMAREIMVAAGFAVDPADENIEIEAVSDETIVKNI